MATPAELERLLRCIRSEILPATRAGVAAGNKVFGAAVLRRAAAGGPLATVVAETNAETANPLFHGEVCAINAWASAGAARRPPAADCVFLATHEPCCLCISAVVWAGFRECYFLFPYETTAAQGIPHDIDIMRDLWRVERYNPESKFCRTRAIADLVDKVEDEAIKHDLRRMMREIEAEYGRLSDKYHSEKEGNAMNTMAFN